MRQRPRLSTPILLLCLSAALSLGHAPIAGAHGTSRSYSTWQLGDESVSVTTRVAMVELTRLGRDPTGPEAERWVGEYLASNLTLSRDGEPCKLGSAPTRRGARDGWIAFAWELRCPPTSGPQEIESRILLREAPGHLHFARANGAGVNGILERVLTQASPAWRLGGDDAPGSATPATRGSSFGSYLTLGVEHILTGWDHLAFLFAFLLLAATVGEVARLVTAFTVAHSVTLALAVLDLLEPEVAAVEAVIGFSVALVAAENSWLLGGRKRIVPIVLLTLLGGFLALSLAGRALLPPLTGIGLLVFSATHFALLERSARPDRIRTALAFAFGLVHGFGFAGVLSELELPVDRLAPALLGFNLGVEVGQLAVVALAWPLLRAMARLGDGRWHRLVAEAGSAAIAGLGLFWFAQRALG